MTYQNTFVSPKVSIIHGSIVYAELGVITFRRFTAYVVKYYLLLLGIIYYSYILLSKTVI